MLKHKDYQFTDSEYNSESSIYSSIDVMLQKNINDMVDERKFYPRSKVVMSVVPKSLLSSNNITIFKGTGESKSLAESETSSIQSLASQLNSQERYHYPKALINAVDAEHKFKMNCYNAFRKYSNIASTGNKIENHGVYGHQLLIAMRQISNLVSIKEIKKLKKSLVINDLDVLSWKDFESFAYTIFEPYFQNNSTFQFIKEQNHVQISNIHQTDAFQCLIRKQRAASAAEAFPQQYSIITGSRAQSPSHGSNKNRYRASPNKEKATSPLSSINKSVVFREGFILGEQLDGTLVPSFEVKEALNDVVKFNERYARKQFTKFKSDIKKKKTNNATMNNQNDNNNNNNNNNILLNENQLDNSLNTSNINNSISPLSIHSNTNNSNNNSINNSINNNNSNNNNNNNNNSYNNSINNSNNEGRNSTFLPIISNNNNNIQKSNNTSPNSTIPKLDSISKLELNRPPPLMKQNSDAHLTLEELEYKRFHYRLPTSKQKLNEIMNPQNAYSTKWLNMKKIRDKAESEKEKREYRKNIMRDINSLAISSDKEIIQHHLQEQRVGVGSIIAQKYSILKQLELNTKENIAQWKEKEKLRKKEAAGELSKALFASTTMSKSMLFEEQADKNTYKSGSINKLPIYSSTIIEIPPSFDKAIQNAKTQKQWDDAVAAKKRYREQILSDRIFDYTLVKSSSILHNIRPGSSTSKFIGEPSTPTRTMEFFTKTSETDEDLIEFNIEYAKYLGDSYSLPSLKPKTEETGEIKDDDTIESYFEPILGSKI